MKNNMKSVKEFFEQYDPFTLTRSVGACTAESVEYFAKVYASYVLEEAAETLVDQHTNGGHQVDADEKSILKLKDKL